MFISQCVLVCPDASSLDRLWTFETDLITTSHWAEHNGADAATDGGVLSWRQEWDLCRVNEAGSETDVMKMASWSAPLWLQQCEGLWPWKLFNLTNTNWHNTCLYYQLIKNFYFTDIGLKSVMCKKYCLELVLFYLISVLRINSSSDTCSVLFIRT